MTVNMNKLREHHKQLKGSYDLFVKENASISQDEKKIQSYLQGLVGDDFYMCMEIIKNSGLSISHHFTSHREGIHIEMDASAFPLIYPFSICLHFTSLVLILNSLLLQPLKNQINSSSKD